MIQLTFTEAEKQALAYERYQGYLEQRNEKSR